MNFERLLELFTVRDLVDVFLVSLVFYNLLLLIRGTRAVQMILGILFVGGVYFLSILADLRALSVILQSFFLVLPLAIVVLFQHEIRRGLAQFGRNPLFGLATQQKVESSLSEVVLAATTLAARRIGALIVIERVEGLRNYIENGILLDARVSYDLLINIFSPDTPLHDGAAIIQGDRVAAAACFLPLTLNPEPAGKFGTRHRAALGVTEETDAVAVVVSEETGILSVAFNGQLTRDLDAKSLRNTLYQHLITDLYPQGRRKAA